MQSPVALRSIAGWLGLALLGGIAAPRAMAQSAEADDRLRGIEASVKSLDEQLRLVEQGFVAHLNSASEESLQQHFGEAEVAFLIEDYGKATSLLYDVVLSAGFRLSPRYYDGVFYLGESLRQQKDYLGAKHFLRELLEAGPGTSHFQDALVSYLDVAARTNDFRDLDRYAQIAESTGRIDPAVEYLIAKATFERTDLPEDERLRSSLTAFARIGPQSPFYPQALYFSGVCRVQSNQLPEARDLFTKVAALPAADATQSQIRELANLAIGRIDYELAKYSEALDAYQNIPESSPAFYDALYEIAWTYVKKGDYENARKAAELLTLGAPEGSLLPEANLLRGQLLLKLGRFDEAEDTYQQVVAKYGPVRDQIDQLLSVNGDPAAYFDRLLAQKSGAFDVASLLPVAARAFATGQKGVREAQAVAQDLGAGRKGITDSDAIVARLEEHMQDAANLGSFPALQAGNERAAAVDSALLQIDTQLGTLEREVLKRVLTSEESGELQRLAASRADLEQRFAKLPKSDSQIEGRERQRLEVLREEERQIFKISLVVQSLRAQAIAVQRLADETRAQASASAADAQRLAGQVSQILAEADSYDAQIGAMVAKVKDEETVNTASGSQDDESLRASYAAALKRQADLLTAVRARAPGQVAAQSETIEAVRSEVGQLRSRTASAMDSIRQAAVVQAQVIRQKLAIETQNLNEYRQEVTADEGDASGLVGRIAYQSFRRVRRQVYDLVLKADVGIVDVAWTRKRGDAEKIQKLAGDKDHELRVLDDEFHEVLEDVE